LAAEERQHQILSLVDANRSMSISGLQQKFDVSRETIRRDLLTLERDGKLRRMHGGAVSLGGILFDSPESDLAVRRAENAEGRRAIGRFIAEMVPDGAAVILGGGTTLEAVAEALAARRGLTVVTNSIPNCLKLSGRNGHRIHLLGGALQATNQVTLGGDAADMLSKYYANFAIIGAGAISRHGEIMDYTVGEAELCRKMLRSAETSIVAADHTAFGSIALVRVESLEAATCIVTDAEPEPAFADILNRLPVRLLVAGKSA
jgi:DeoR family transcriptional regulator, glycerol-3-phosphate regulon repressor